MPVEIERKFLVNHERWNAIPKPAGQLIRQGYLHNSIDYTIRIRISGSDAFMAVKGITVGASRSEFEYPIPLKDAQQMLSEFCAVSISKTRYTISQDPHCWEVDVFEEVNYGLIVAEIELTDESDAFEKPDWLAEEVTHDPRYYNANLILNPFTSWR